MGFCRLWRHRGRGRPRHCDIEKLGTTFTQLPVRLGAQQAGSAVNLEKPQDQQALEAVRTRSLVFSNRLSPRSLVTFRDGGCLILLRRWCRCRLLSFTWEL
jgi:hypothetical protein